MHRLLLTALLALASCAGPMMSTDLGAGPRAWPKSKPKRSASSDAPAKDKSLDIPLNFALISLSKESLSPHVSKVSESHLTDFLSVGVTEISKALSLDSSAWRCELVEGALPIPPDSLATEPGSGAVIRVKYSLQSPVGMGFRSTGGSRMQGLVAELDSSVSDVYEYRAQVSANVACRFQVDTPDRVFFDIDFSLLLQRKSWRAAKKHFRPIGISGYMPKEKVKWHLNAILPRAYELALEAHGLEVGRSEGR